MNQREKEEYLREYAILKSQGKPFFPYAVAKDAAMACVVMAVIIAMSLILGAELGSKANPTTTTYVPRPEWYFFFLFEVLRVIKPPSLVPLATIGVPTIGMILLFLLPFYDRGPERRPEHRPIATVTGIFVIGAMAFLTYQGANAGSPTAIEMATPTAVTQAGGTHARRIRSRQGGGRPVGMRGVSQDRRQRQQRTRAGTDAHRLAIARAGDRAHAREPDGADAFVQEPAAAEVQRGRRLPVAAEVAGARPCLLEPAGTRPNASPMVAGRGRIQTSPADLEAGQVRAMFDRIARVYDLLNTVMTAGLHHRWRERAADLARVGPGGRVLDVATGTGDLAIELARRVAPGGEVVGSDFSEAMLARRAPSPSPRAPSCASSGATRSSCPLRTGRFDAATVGFGARNFSDLAAVWGRWRVSCAPAAAWSCSSSPLPRARRCRSSTASGSTASCRCWGACAGDPDAYSYLPNSVKRFPAPAGLAAELERAGLRGIGYLLTAGGIVVIHFGTVPPEGV